MDINGIKKKCTSSFGKMFFLKISFLLSIHGLRIAGFLKDPEGIAKV